MTDIQRYFMVDGTMRLFGPHEPFVTYADHVEAVKQAVMEAHTDCERNNVAAYEQGKRDCKATHAVMGMEEITRIAQEGYDRAIADAVQRVEALPWSTENWFAVSERASVIAAIKDGQA